MINNETLNLFHYNAFIIYNEKDWQTFLLKINPYLIKPFSVELLEIYLIHGRPLYIRMIYDSFKNGLIIHGWDFLYNYDKHNTSKVSKVDCKEGLPNWVLDL